MQLRLSARPLMQHSQWQKSNFQIHNLLVFMKKKSLSNSKMGKLVARLLGRTELEVKDGKVELTSEERRIVVENYGQAFLDKLDSVELSEDEDALELFNAAVAAKVAESRTEMEATVKRLQEDILRLSQEPEPAPMDDKKAAQEARAFAVNMAASHNKLVSQALASDNPMVFAALENGTVDVADLNKEFSMTMPPKVKLDLLAKRLYLGFNDAKYMTRIQSNTDYIASAAIFSEVAQQFTSKWTPKGTAKFTPIRIPYRRHKINVTFNPADVIKSWLLWMYEQGKTPAEMPITKYLVEEHILPKVLDDITLSMIGKGKFVEVNAGDVRDGDAGTPAKQAMDGYETILVEGLKDSNCKINYLRTAKDYRTLSDEALLKYVDSFVDNISGQFAKAVTIFCSEQFKTRYKRADFAVNGKYTGIEAGDTIRFTNFRLVTLESMYNSPILFATPQANFVELVDYSRAENCINRIENSNYDVKVFGEFSLSVGFKIAEAVFAAVPANYNPQESILADTVDKSVWMNGGEVSSLSEGEGA